MSANGFSDVHKVTGVAILMRTSPIQYRHQFFRGTIAGLILVGIKFVFFLPVDITVLLYGVAILLILIITTAELLEYRPFIREARVLDFVAGFLFPLDCYAVLVLFGVPLTNLGEDRISDIDFGVQGRLNT